MPAHTHSPKSPASDFITWANAGANLASSAGSSMGGGSAVTGSTGGSGAHNNMQPYGVFPFVIRFQRLRTHTLSGAENGPHNHQQHAATMSDGGVVGGWGADFTMTTNTWKIQPVIRYTSDSGNGSPHNNMQPWGAFPFAVRFQPWTHIMSVAELATHSHPPASPYIAFVMNRYPTMDSHSISGAPGYQSPNITTTGPAGGSNPMSLMQPWGSFPISIRVQLGPHIMTVAEMPAHGHGVYGNGMPMQLVDSYATDAAGYNRYRFAAGASQLAASSTGGSSAFSLMQPYGVFPIALRF